MSARRRRAVIPADPVSPTPERIAHAGGGYSVSRDGLMRVVEAPLDVLRERCALAKCDPDTNGVMFHAGDQLRRDWQVSGLVGSKAIDYSRTGGGDGDPVHAMPVSEYAAAARWRVRNALRALDEREAAVVGAVVIDEMPLEQAGRYLGRKAHVPLAKRRAIELAITALRSGLTALAKHYGMMR